MNYIELLKILTKWSSDNGEFELLYNIYTIFNIGIPNKLLYNFPSNGVITMSRLRCGIHNKDIFLKKIMEEFRHSKFKKLSCWSNTFGFIKIK